MNCSTTKVGVTEKVEWGFKLRRGPPGDVAAMRQPANRFGNGEMQGNLFTEGGGKITMYRHWIAFLWTAVLGWAISAPMSAATRDAESDAPPPKNVVGEEGMEQQQRSDDSAGNVSHSPNGELVDYEQAESFDAYPAGDEYGSPDEYCGSCGGDCGSCGGNCGSCAGECGSGGVGPCECCSTSRGWYANGWIAQGFTGNPDNPSNGFNGPLTFNDRANEYQLNQIYLSLGRQVDTSSFRWGVGGRVDLLYGTDYFFTTSLGLETHGDGSPRWNRENGPRAGGATLYGVAMPQVYAEGFAPIGGGVTVKVGHFYSLLGYESVMAAENFFYSHSYASQYGVPYTHTGVLGEYRVTSCLQVQGGITRGWDNWEDNNDELAFIGQVRWCSGDGRSSVRFALHSGNEDNLGLNTRTTYSLIATRRVTCRFNYAIEHVMGTEANGAIRNNEPVDADWFGVTNYLTYEVGCRTQVGVRFEWFRDDDNARVLGIPLDGAVGGDYHALTVGANHRLCALPFVEIRPELLYDWSDAAFPGLNVQGLFNNFTSDTQLTYSINAIARF